MKYSGFIGPAYNLEDPIDRQDCINLYYERDELGTGKNGEQGRLLATPGFCRDGLDDKVWRQNGLFPASNGKVYGVSGNQVYVITDGASGLVATLMTQAGGAAFTLNTTSGYIDWADSGEYILFTHETGTATGGLIQIRLSDDTVSTKTFETVYGTVARYPRTVEFHKGRFVVGVRQSSRGLWFYSDIVSVTPIPTFSALYFFTAESDPDTTTQIKAAGDYLWLGGTKTLEVWQATGDYTLPFAPIPGAAISHGTVGKTMVEATVNGNSTLAYVGKDGNGVAVYAANGIAPAKISTNALDRHLTNMNTTDDAFAFMRYENGHSFYVIVFPTGRDTWVYDFNSGAWHQWLSFDDYPEYGGVLSRHQANACIYAYGRHIVACYATNLRGLFKLDPECPQEFLLPIVRQRTGPPIASNLQRIRHSKFQLDMRSGVGLDGVGIQSGLPGNNFVGTDPTISMQYSDDGGFTWSNWRDQPMGKIGEYKTRQIWRMLGQSRGRMYRVRTSAPVVFSLIGTDLEIG